MAALSALLALAGCGGGGPDEGPQPLVNPAERALYDPVNRPDGLVPRRASGLVLFQLEPAAGPARPAGGDSASLGVDQLWFDVVRDGFVGVNLEAADLVHVASVELLDSDGQRVWLANAAEPNQRARLLRGSNPTWARYQLRITAAAGAPRPVRALAWFGFDKVASFSGEDLERLASESPGLCQRCDLEGVYLGHLPLANANLSQSNLRRAWLGRADWNRLSLQNDSLVLALFLNESQAQGADLSAGNFSGADLSGALFSGAGLAPAKLRSADFLGATLDEVVLDGADMAAINLSGGRARRSSFIGADLSASNLQRADLRDAYLSGAKLASANLSEADLSGADLAGANLANANVSGTVFTGAVLDGATWTDGRTCAPGSLGTCLAE